MRELFDFRSSKCRMLILAIVDIFTVVISSFLAILIRYELRADMIPVEYLECIKVYMLPNIIVTLIVFCL